MKLVNKLFTRTNKMLIAFIMIFILLQNIGLSKIIVSFFHAKNGSSFILGDYKIEFPFSHWAYFGESHLAYVIAGREINSKNLSAEFFKNSKTIEISEAVANCDTVNKQIYNSLGINGKIYICSRAKNETMYFFSNDKSIFIRETDFNSSDLEIMNEYKLLFNSISKLN